MGLRERTSPGARVSFDAAHRTDRAVQTQPPTIKKNTRSAHTRTHTDSDTHTRTGKMEGWYRKDRVLWGGEKEVALDGDCQNR